MQSSEKNLFNGIAGEIVETKAFLQMKKYIQHGTTTTYEHSMMVAYFSFLLMQRLHIRYNSRRLIRGALLHDLFLYDWHTQHTDRGLHGFTHPQAALENAQRFFEVDAGEANIIKSHMWPLTIRCIPQTREAVAVCAVDKFCSLLETAHISLIRFK